ncbi:protein farnesyltransferase subunit beta-like isoform X3 [Manihot esculenta]|uniref:protein farnesyltransferase subunit beta-like isoform X3 n=1 Tax=Manihot esculenta TaxID=3983 RepID=UPI001CC6593B|nr:protein farnesyltransferase subunit beta-like isoform X3 [Manihot esculenta]XP_043808622.1 protein farnesyltransferase subunit beta-like isoform X3 [Manihot esculenta]XP_043808623.1 protein farnesyltransferase subunit beta-like isoform X3 [Manihot esculenta]
MKVVLQENLALKLMVASQRSMDLIIRYTFCGLAAMILINEDRVVFRQGVECGFQGRTNKLVDGCYSFWQGGVFALLKGLHSVNGEHVAFSDAEEGDSATDGTSEGEDGNSLGTDETCHIKRGVGDGEMAPLFHSVALQQYIILCPQEQKGGFRDKPGKARDYYHTCYCLSGLSVCQYSQSKDEHSPPLPRAVLGPYSNLLEPVHPLYNVVLKQYHEAHEFFSSQSTS